MQDAVRVLSRGIEANPGSEGEVIERSLTKVVEVSALVEM